MSGETVASDVVRLRVSLRASPMLIALIVAVHLIAGAVVAASGVVLWLKPCLVAVLVISLWRAVTEHGLRLSGRSVTALSLESSAAGRAGRWRLVRADGSEADARLSKVAYRHPQLICLCFEDWTGNVPARDDRNWRHLSRAITSWGIGTPGVTVVIPGDATTPAAHRRLRVALGNPSAH